MCSTQLHASPPGSVWWRAVNERLLRDGCETIALLGGLTGQPRSQAVRLWLEFSAAPTGRNWYRAHNARSWAPTSTTRETPKPRAHPQPLSRRMLRSGTCARGDTRTHRMLRRGSRWMGRLRLAALSARPAPRDGRSVPLTRAGAPGPLSAHPRRRALYRGRAPSRPDARLRGNRSAAAMPVPVVSRGTRRTTSAWNWCATATRSTPGRSSSDTSGAIRRCRSQPG